MYAPPKRIFDSGKRMIELIFWHGLMPSTSAKIIMFMISGSTLRPAMMSSGVPDCESCPGKINISAGFRI